MATEPAFDFDLGPLSWVQSEIDQALSRGLEALAAFSAQPKDVTSLKHARTHVHQAAGAIQMVGLDAVVAFTDEIERRVREKLPAMKKIFVEPDSDGDLRGVLRKELAEKAATS